MAQIKSVLLEDQNVVGVVYTSREGIATVHTVGDHFEGVAAKVRRTDAFQDGDFVVLSSRFKNGRRKLEVLFGSLSQLQAVFFGAVSDVDNQKDFFGEGDKIVMSNGDRVVDIETAFTPCIEEGDADGCPIRKRD